MSTTLPSTPVRVVLADMPRLTRELIRRALEEEPGVQVVREVSDADLSLRQLIEETEAEVVIAETDTGLLAECRDLLDERAPLRVLALSADGRGAHLYGVQPYEIAVDEFSFDFVFEAVRRP
jgi:DNA-binding NarL/FixJ family response regulator